MSAPIKKERSILGFVARPSPQPSPKGRGRLPTKSWPTERRATGHRFSFYKHLVPTALSRQTLRSVSAVLCCFKRQLNAKGRSLSWLALNVDVATVQVEDLAHDRQA